ncbi:MAG: hypothetical protein QNI97_13895 [Desulfobacterales bacterium]|nr:hypothetical protein [Desulfobacterales bacterium]
MKKCLILPMLIILLLFSGCATNQKAWENAIDKQTRSRFIPIELWSGSSWSGEKTLRLEPVDFTFGRRNHKTIRGPFQWTHPKTGEALWVYERINRTKKGDKRQLFTVNPEGTGLAKVFDERPGSPTRYFSTNAVIFPLGNWIIGEKRYFDFDEYTAGKTFKRTVLIHLRRQSFTYKEVKYAMKYDWIMTDDQGQRLFHERFIYGPGESLMYFRNRMPK